MKKTILSLFLLFSNIILCQDKQWVTFNGANSRIPNNSINSVVIDKQNVKWVGTEGYGIARFDGVNWTTFNDKNSGLSNNSVRVIYADEDNNKWIGTRYGGLYKFDGTTWTNWNTTNSFLPSNWVASFVIDPKGVIWIGTGDKGLARVERDNWVIFNKSNSPLPVDPVYSLAADSLGNIWIGTNGGGLARFDGVNWEIKNKYNSNLTCNASLSIAIDKNNDKWIASFTCGLFRLHDTTFTKYDKYISPLPDHWVACVSIDRDQAKWIGMDSTGVVKFSGNQWTIYDTANSGLPDKYIRSIAIDDLGNKWIGTFRGGLTIFNENGVNFPKVIIVSQPVNGANWIAGSKQQITWDIRNITGNVNIKLSTDGGTNFPIDLASNTANDGVENITVPGAPSSKCAIKVESISNPDVKGITGGKIQIVAMTKPIQLKPANNSSKQPLDVKLTWNKGAWCDKYRLIVAADSTFLNPIIQDSSLTDTLKELKGLVDFRHYFWKVQGLNSGLTTQWSPVWKFTTVFNAPDNLTALAIGSKIKLTWKDNSLSETGYIIERSSGSGFTTLATLQANSTQFTDSSLSAPGNYQYRVKAASSGGESEYSNIASASVTAVNDHTPMAADFELAQNFPNPFNPATTIRYSLPEQSDVKLTIYNLLGMTIRAFKFDLQPAGYHNAVWNGKDLNNEQASSGTYLCKLEATTINGKVIEKIIKMILLK